MDIFNAQIDTIIHEMREDRCRLAANHQAAESIKDLYFQWCSVVASGDTLSGFIQWMVERKN
jgi:hypothetical protein